MKIISSLINSLAIVFILYVPASALAGTSWDIGIIFITKNTDGKFQKDVEKNILEISKIKSNTDLNLNIFKISNDQDEKLTSKKLKLLFKTNNRKKALIVYSHGAGPYGLRDYPTLQFKSQFLKGIPQLDFIWLDSCFMSNLEFLYEIRNHANYIVASEDAEFSSGLPFNALEELPKSNDVKTGIIALANDFISSYSYLLKGKQKNSVDISSATISVINTGNLDRFVKNLSQVRPIIDSLPVEAKDAFLKSASLKLKMDNEELIDLGSFLISLRKIIKNKNDDKTLTDLIRKIGINSVSELKTNPRIKISIPENKENIDQMLIYGFNNWKNGHENDYKKYPEKFNGILKPDGFIEVNNGVLWPFKKIRSNNIYLNPYGPNINQFDYFIYDNSNQKVLSKNSFMRDSDTVIKIGSDPEAIISYTAYTQKIGANAEKYTGINILLPYSAPKLDYYDLEIYSILNWH